MFLMGQSYHNSPLKQIEWAMHIEYQSLIERVFRSRSRIGKEDAMPNVLLKTGQIFDKVPLFHQEEETLVFNNENTKIDTSLSLETSEIKKTIIDVDNAQFALIHLMDNSLIGYFFSNDERQRTCLIDEPQGDSADVNIVFVQHERGGNMYLYQDQFTLSVFSLETSINKQMLKKSLVRKLQIPEDSKLKSVEESNCEAINSAFLDKNASTLLV